MKVNEVFHCLDRHEIWLVQASMAIAGDLNGDGYDDVIFGARKADPGGRIDAGAAYVVLVLAALAFWMVRLKSPADLK